MEMNDIEKAKAKREFEVFAKKIGINIHKPIHDQLIDAAQDGRLKKADDSRCCAEKCTGHSSKDL